jgi:hypothetical protein
MTDDQKWEQALLAAAEIRKLRESEAHRFLEIGEKCAILKESNLWKKIAKKWRDFVEDSDQGLNLPLSTSNNYIGIYEYYIDGALMSKEEAAKCGPWILQKAKSKIKKLEDDNQMQAIEILKTDMRPKDKMEEIIALLPEEQRDSEKERQKILDTLHKAWQKLNDLLSEDMDDDFKGEARDYLDKLAGLLLR